MRAPVGYRPGPAHVLAHEVMHMATHGAYHRGQVALLVRDAGADPLATDFIVYMREQ